MNSAQIPSIANIRNSRRQEVLPMLLKLTRGLDAAASILIVILACSTAFATAALHA